MGDKEKGCMVAVLSVLGVPVLIALSAVTSGWALSILWGWFVVPVFGLPALTIAQAVGVSYVVSFLTRRTAQPNKGEKEHSDVVWGVSVLFIAPLLTLGIGWIIHLFV